MKTTPKIYILLQVTVFDTPGLGSDDIEDDLHNLRQILNLVKDLRNIKTVKLIYAQFDKHIKSQSILLLRCWIIWVFPSGL